jgi:hypothetical protein
MIKMIKKKPKIFRFLIISVGIGLALLISLIIRHRGVKITQFEQDTQLSRANKQNKLLVDNSGVVKYYFDNWSDYQLNSKLIEGFESLKDLKVTNGELVRLGQDCYQGNSSLSFKTNKSSQSIEISKKLQQPTDLSRWDQQGMLSFWMKIEDRKGLTKIGLEIGDINGNQRSYFPVSNLQTDLPNTKESDDIFPNLDFPDQSNLINQWTDYLLNTGWNFVFFRSDPAYFNQTNKVDFQKIVSFRIIIETNNQLKPQVILVDDLRVQDGLQKKDNSLGGVWFPPNNAPQYGVFEVDHQDNQSILKLLNVRETQYPSNGDHGRIVSKFKTPENFSLRIQFRLTNGPKSKKERFNTWLRATYDFEPDDDPGHDWLGSFISLEYNIFGLISVKPLETMFSQEQEPSTENIKDSSQDFSIKLNQWYELDLTTRGQNSKATIYELNGKYLRFKKESSYQFKRKRYGPSQRYPFAIEVTGNTKAEIKEIEISQL